MITFGDAEGNPNIYSQIPSIRESVSVALNPFNVKNKLYILVDNEEDQSKLINRILNDICFNSLIRQQILLDNYPIKSVLYKTIYNETAYFATIATNEDAKRILSEKIDNINIESVKNKYKNLYDILITRDNNSCYILSSIPVSFKFEDKDFVYFSVSFSEARCIYDVISDLVGTTASILLSLIKSQIIAREKQIDYENESTSINIDHSTDLKFKNITKVEIEMLGFIYPHLYVYEISQDSVNLVSQNTKKEILRIAFDITSAPYKLIGKKAENKFEFNLN